MIAEECKKLRRQLEEVARAEVNEKTVKLLNERRRELDPVRNDVKAAIESLEAMSRRANINSELNASKAFERVRKLREELKRDPMSLTKGNLWGNMTDSLIKFTGDVKKATELEWGNYLPRVRPGVDKEQLAQAKQQEAFKRIASDIETLLTNAEFRSKKPPATETKFSELESIWNDLRAKIQSLPSVTNDPNVRQFIEAANSRTGASLKLLTEEVLAWLNENKMADKYSIVNLQK